MIDLVWLNSLYVYMLRTRFIWRWQFKDSYDFVCEPRSQGNAQAKTISTLEYGVKAKCIVHGPHTPVKAGESSSSDVFLGSNIAAMKIIREREREGEDNEAHKQIL